MAGATGENTDSSAASPRQQASRKPPKNRLSCQVTLLDGTFLNTDHLQVSVLNEFFAQIQFGLSYFFNISSLQGLSCFNGCCNRSFNANHTATNSALTMKLSSCSVSVLSTTPPLNIGSLIQATFRSTPDLIFPDTLLLFQLFSNGKSVFL